ncbi:MAG TPA: hypothetical protein VIG08_12860 [Gemmatimonadales bacterium]|jgi:hypothetical protein
MSYWRHLAVVSLVALAPAGRLEAQSEATLRQYFEGKTVTMRLAMPGTEDGVDLYPTANPPIDYPRYAGRLKDHGTAIRAGESVMVTKIKVKSDLIEFQLAGGGYGTFGDETSSNVSVPSTPKTKREKNLEAEIKRETDPNKKRDMKEELDDLKSAREREDARNRAEVADAQEQKKDNIRQRRLEGGSRFNLRYKGGIPASALTPESVKAALADYVVFERTPADASPLQPGPEAAPPTPTGGLPRKGMLVPEVDRLLGTPRQTSERKEGRLTVKTRVYDAPTGQVTAEFVEGVLIRFTATSN